MFIKQGSVASNIICILFSKPMIRNEIKDMLTKPTNLDMEIKRLMKRGIISKIEERFTLTLYGQALYLAYKLNLSLLHILSLAMLYYYYHKGVMISGKGLPVAKNDIINFINTRNERYVWNRVLILCKRGFCRRLSNELLILEEEEYDRLVVYNDILLELYNKVYSNYDAYQRSIF
ncbi:MAG: hypothetical protein QW416_04505 [Candidatus Nitrosocaldaceae archaeon]